MAVGEGDLSGRPWPRLLPPAPLVALVGREAELDELFALVLEPDVRLLTITGVGGVGKSLLAVHLANAVQGRFGGGVLVLPLAGIADAELLLPTLAQALGLPLGGPDLAGRVAERLRRARTLLVLDNLEHLPGATPVVPGLLRDSPGLTIVATSRTVLGCSGERHVSLDVLAVPPAHGTSDEATAAERLFTERATSAGCDPRLLRGQAEAVRALCRWTEGLPLAIELAAAQTRTFPPAALVARGGTRLELLAGGPLDLPARQRSLAATIAWSYDLLAEPVRRLFERLSVCEGGFSLEAAAAMARGWRAADGYPNAGGLERQAWQPDWADGGHEPPVEDGTWPRAELEPLDIDPWSAVDAMVRASLVRPAHTPGGEPRFAMLEAIREYGRLRLRARGEEAAALHAHARWAVQWGEMAAVFLWAAEREPWLERLEHELPNIRAALRWLEDQPAPAVQLALRLSEALWPYWQTRGNPAEGRRWLTAALARPGGTARARANAGNVAGLLAWFQRDDEEAVAYLTAAAELAGTVDWPIAAGRATFALALVAWRREEWVLMYALLTHARDMLERADDPVDTGMCETALALIAHKSGHTGEALGLLDAALARFTEQNFTWGLGACRFYRGVILHAGGDLGRAITELQDALGHFAGFGDLWGIGGSLTECAVLAFDQGDLAGSARLLGAASVYSDEADAALPPTEEGRYREHERLLRERLGEEAFARGYTAGRALALPAAVAEVRALADAVRGRPAPTELARIRAQLTPELEEMLALRRSHPALEIAHRRLAGIGKSQVYGRLAQLRAIFGVDDDAELLLKAKTLGVI